LAYISRDKFEEFLDFNIAFDIVEDYYEHKSILKMLGSEDLQQRTGGCLKTTWDFYPTYEAYVGMMTQFASEFPEICEMHSLGTLESGREILALKISDNVGERENEPKFLYTSSMHGDETAGFPLLLRLSDYLLCNYDNDDRVARLVDNIEIWINPLANPNGTYRNDNSTVNGATRGNGNNLDLNRNYPDPDDGPHPDGRDYQEETVIFMDFAERERFNISANFHGGIELFNYPWDTFSELPADVEWWLCLGRAYADTVHVHSPNGYFDAFDNGLTNGFEWFEVRGGRQDYMIYNFGGREFTLELSNRKLLDSEDLPDIWEYNFRSMLNYLEEADKGLRGIITDSETGEPIEAEVFIEGHDELNSQVNSSLPFGGYFRYLAEGDYEVTYSSEDYKSETISTSLAKGEQLTQDVELTPRSVSNKNQELENVKLWVDNNLLYFDTPFNAFDIRLVNTAGKFILSKSKTDNSAISLPESLVSGVYFVEINYQNTRRVVKVIL
jgi:hypothetical protein